ncbi:Rpn family recombination-promoting nuclease/putative transposase [Virgibacillus halodenitrificans]|uniref:Rpn family recombination-promoting nuclease/putative transposase n=1 Tax=Virgibacillus halodenitrificans TaxID=1482 RepID=UPI001F23B896|nr:Rpn family recombination-promoting nuclease/putative transposase [Virgibacillus halodenitrificans]MCG1027640.1 Rpn family recombination-promoting nuclease/putative transposase [Virgibacillus halodenitrificans]
MPLNIPLRPNSSSITVMEDAGFYKQKSANQTGREKLLKHVPLEKLMDLKVDYAIKQLFGSDKNKDITVVFLNAILKKSGRKVIKEIAFTSTESGGEYVDDKQSRLDFLAITDENERINVEIQFTNKYDMVKRSIYYWASIYRSPLQKRMSYKELQPVIAINIMNFNLFQQTDRFHTMYHLYEDEEKFKLTDVMGFHFIEMPRLIRDWKNGNLDPWNDVLVRWLLMLGMVDYRNKKVYDDIYQELEAIAMKDKSVRAAFQNWEQLSMTQEEYFAYESRLKQINDEEAAQREAELRLQEVKEKAIREGREEGFVKGLEEGKKDGRVEGRQEGLAKGIAEGKAEGIAEGIKEGEKSTQEKIARRLLINDMDSVTVAETTGLSIERVIQLQREI